ncbi:3D domain-containing protein [Clostridium celatum]|uniref:3D domain-containing protein n=1 Tax=Clostridium celatum TaxID=36834 RepID=UPI00290D1783|nr:3D domain-containing protein [Clostridium celatum]MDU6294897.1 3D domain-containing protein [Clostridium celatum]
MYKSNMSSNIILSILTSTSLSDFVSRVQSISRLVTVDKEILTDINEKKDKLNDSIERLNSKEQDLRNLKLSIENDLEKITEIQKSQEEALEELNSQKDSVAAIIEENENQLISHSLSIINSSTSTSELQNAIDTLNLLLPQLSSSNVISKANDAIYNANLKIEELNTIVVDKPVIGENMSTSKKTFTMEATAYTGGGITAMGLPVVRDPNGLSTIAVDKSIIPLGSKVYVSGYGVAIASDTGGAIKGNIIDVYLNTYEECVQWGRRTVTVDILAYPGEW